MTAVRAGIRVIPPTPRCWQRGDIFVRFCRRLYVAWRVAGRLRERVECWPTVDDRWVRVRRYETPWEVLPDEVKQSLP